MMIAGKTTWLGYCKSTFCPLDNITPMDGSGAWRPSPMYARKDSEKMAVGMAIMELVMMGPMELGRI